MEAPLTPQEQAVVDKLENDLPHTPIIKSLTENQDNIIKMVEEERAFNKIEFDRGTEKFKEISSELKEVRSEVSDMKSQIKDGFKQQREDLAKHLSETKDNQILDLKETIEKKNIDTDKRDTRISSIKDGILVTLVSGILLATALYFLLPAK